MFGKKSDVLIVGAGPVGLSGSSTRRGGLAHEIPLDADPLGEDWMVRLTRGRCADERLCFMAVTIEYMLI